VSPLCCSLRRRRVGSRSSSSWCWAHSSASSCWVRHRSHTFGVRTGSASPSSFPPSYPRCCVTSSAPPLRRCVTLRRCVPSSASFPPPRFRPPPHFHPLRVRHFPSPLPHRFCPPPPHLGGAGGCVVSKGVLGAVRVVDGPYTSLLGGSSFLIVVSSLFAVVSPLICVALHLRCFGVSFGPGCRVRGISEGDRKRDSENEPRQVSWLVFRNSPPRLPTSPAPLVFLPPRISRRERLSRPHPFGKGRGGWDCILACEGAVAMEVEPTSLNRGEGLAAGWSGDVGGVQGEGEGEGGGGEVVVEEGENERSQL
jgi:hypothetical protein